MNGQVPAFRFSLYIRIARSILSALAAAAGRIKLVVKFSVKEQQKQGAPFHADAARDDIDSSYNPSAACKK